MKKVIVIGGGTISHVRAHMAICAPAYGQTARKIYEICDSLSGFLFKEFTTALFLTKMAGGANYETNEDISELVGEIVLDKDVKMVFFNAALCDFTGQIGEVESGKYADRLKTREGNTSMVLTPADKVIANIKKDRPDIFLIGFKTTNNASEEEQLERGVNLVRESGCDLVLANDLSTRKNMIINSDCTQCFLSTDRDESIEELVIIAKENSNI